MKMQMKNTQKGFMTQFLFAVALAITVGGGIYWYQVSKNSESGKMISFAELVKPIVNTTLQYSNPDLAFRTTVGKKLFPGQVEINSSGDSFVPFKYNYNPKSNVTEGTIKIIRNEKESCLQNPSDQKENKNGVVVGYMNSGGDNGSEWEKNFIRSFVKGNDKFCIEAVIRGLTRASTDNLVLDEKQAGVDKEALTTFEQYVKDATDNFKIIIY